MTTAIHVEGLSFRYPRQKEPTLRDVDLQIQSGECVLLLGSTGCGKSTLALCINGLIPHLLGGEMHGRVYIQGIDTQQCVVGDLARQVGLVFQDPEAQFCMLTVEDEIAFGLENLGLPPAEMDKHIDAALDLVGMSTQRHTRLDRLSGGMKQRLALAAVLAMGPHILILDEPTSNLDPQGTSEFFAHLATLKTRGYTMLLIEHKLDELMDPTNAVPGGHSLVDHVVVMGSDGRILSQGNPHSVFHKDAARLLKDGIWLPQVTELAFRLNQFKPQQFKQLPINRAEAAEVLGPLFAQRSATQRMRQVDILSGKHSILQTIDLEYTYPHGPQVLSSLSLEIHSGELLALVGANGSGKTTLSLQLCGVLTPTRGDVLLKGTSISRVPNAQLAAQIGYVFQNPEHQFVTDTVFDELAYGLRLRQMPERDVRSHVESMLSEFGLADCAGRNPFQLSQGQKRRLSVATMLILSQKVLILDEPTFGQDRRNAYRLMDEMRRLQQSGHTIVFATHDMRLVAEYATRVAVLDGGHILFDRQSHELFAQTEMLKRARLEAPTLYTLSQTLRAQQADLPALATITEYCAYLKAACP